LGRFDVGKKLSARRTAFHSHRAKQETQRDSRDKKGKNGSNGYDLLRLGKVGRDQKTAFRRPPAAVAKHIMRRKGTRRPPCQPHLLKGLKENTDRKRVAVW